MTPLRFMFNHVRKIIGKIPDQDVLEQQKLSLEGEIPLLRRDIDNMENGKGPEPYSHYPFQQTEHAQQCLQNYKDSLSRSLQSVSNIEEDIAFFYPKSESGVSSPGVD